MSVNGHLYSETTCILRGPKAQYILTSIKPPLYKGHYEVSLAWPFNTGFSVDQKESMYRAGGCNDQPVRTNLGVVELDSFIRGYHDQ